MDNLSNIYYVLRFIVGQIFVYVRDIILHEYFWMNEEIDKLEVPEAKGRTHLFTRRAIADFVAFFTICAFFGSFVVFSAKYVKDDENRYNRPPRAVTPESEGEPVEILEDDDCVISYPPDVEDPNRNNWGDGPPLNSNTTTFPRRKIRPQHRNRAEIRRSTSSIFHLRPTHSQHSQSTQTSEKIIQRTANNREWLIRRTRSGHVYGKYPM